MADASRKSALAIFAHPDDIEFVAAGTLLQLGLRGWELHYLNLCSGNGGSVQMDALTTAETRLKEAQAAARILGAHFHPPIADDLELFYGPEMLKKVAAIVRETRPSIVLTHSPQDYMEDHMNASRLAVTAAFAHGIPNFQTEPPRASFTEDVTVYHAMPHGLSDPLRQKIRAGLYVNTTAVHERKRDALALHVSQKHWLDVSQGMDSYLSSMDDLSLAVGRLSGRFEHAEGWRRHLHLGFSAKDIDPLRAALEADCTIDESYESALSVPR
ncbi:MAG: LmbE family protein [Proteobacteria bacterium]|nr:LmbE family protein [Pseudomonadota bacterium]